MFRLKRGILCFLAEKSTGKTTAGITKERGKLEKPGLSLQANEQGVAAMPKKTSTARSGTHRQKTKAQRNVELVRPASEERKPEETVEESTPQPVNNTAATAAAAPEIIKSEAQTEQPKAGSASSRIAARRQASHRTPQRNAATLITPEHFSYVRRDLIYIAILACIMIGAIIALYFIFLQTSIKL